MPGQTSCFRCGSVLESGGVAVDVHPPRAARWKRPFRNARRWIRRHSPTFYTVERVAGTSSAAIVRMGWDTLADWVDEARALARPGFYLLLSIVPGLGHVVQGRFREVRWYCLGWFMALAACLLLYRTSIGLFFYGATIGLHAYIAIHAARLLRLADDLSPSLAAVVILMACVVGFFMLFQVVSFGSPIFLLVVVAMLSWGGLVIGVPVYVASRDTEAFQRVLRFLPRVAAVLVVLLSVWGLYAAVADLLLGGLTGGYTALNIPYQNVRSGDYLLARRSLAMVERLPRGALVLVPVGRLYDIGTLRRAGETMIGQIVGLPGETVQIERLFRVDSVELDAQRYPVPGWLSARRLTVNVPENSYFVSCEYKAIGGVTPAAVQAACVVPQSNIEARAFMRWNPVWRRGFLKETE